VQWRKPLNRQADDNRVVHLRDGRRWSRLARAGYAVAMLFTQTPVAGAFVVSPERIADERGFFARTWCQREFEDHGLNPALAQCNVSFNASKGTLRGMHYQIPPHEEAKLVRCTSGAIYDVAIDLRPTSPTFGAHAGAVLSADNRAMLYIPEGCAHGFLTLEDDTEGFYQMWELVAELYPICRSITGDGVRQTLGLIGRHLDLDVHEVATGTPVLDWTVPREWNLHQAWVKDPSGRKVIDAARSNLHVVGYSTPVDRSMPLAELREHLFTLPQQPDWIPYRTSYYAESWGFCATQRLVDTHPEGQYQVRVDATLAPGQLTYAEHFLPGQTRDEVLVSCHVCHPSLANDNLSGIAVATWLGRRLGQAPRRYGYRLLFVPGTIGSITWLAHHQQHLDRIKHGLVLACV